MSDKLKNSKKMAERFLEYQLDMIKSLSELTYNEIIEFNQWYKTHPNYLIVPQMTQAITEYKNRIIKSK